MSTETPSFQTRDYFFDLPNELIAAVPLEQRDTSRLMVVHRAKGIIEHRSIQDLPEILDSSYSIVANNTKVIRARLLGERVGTGGKVEFFLLRKLPSHEGSLSRWQGLMKTGAKVNPGFEFFVNGAQGKVLGKVIAREDTNSGAIFTAEFSSDPVVAQLGEVPLPPYIQAKLEGQNVDLSSEKVLREYNTLFASEEGSVAAPTAGRHFTPELIRALSAKGIDWNELTLHVGIGTFKPVTVSDLREHLMHAEATTISPAVAQKLNQAKREHRKILSIGTTSTRALEGFCDAQGVLESGTKDINIFIYPGSEQKWKFVDAMLTNFHLPESTLLMMVASFIGSRERAMEIYQEAIREKYRFYSYGDAMLIL